MNDGDWNRNADTAKELHDCITESLKQQLQLLRVEVSDAGVVLHGTCDSFHIKQLAQEIITKNTSRRILANRIVVRSQAAPSPDVVSSSLVGSHGWSTFATIFHPSDFTKTSEVAFAHALAIAVRSKAHLQLMHADVDDSPNWEDFPSVREILSQWKAIPEKDGKERFGELGLTVSKVIASSNNPVLACLNFFEVHDVDLIVLSVHQRDGLMRWLAGDEVEEKISSASKLNTLFVPAGLNGFVSTIDGSIQLKSILVPVVKKPRPEASLQFAQKLISSLGPESGLVTLLHVGESDTMPFLEYPTVGGWEWKRSRVEGDAVESILRVADDIEADLIIMTTDGPDRFLDGLRGTTSERVLRKAKCPVAVIPVESP